MSEVVIGHTIVKKARKRHKCFWCGELIQLGEPYSYWGWASDGSVERIKVHPECDTVWQAACDDDFGGVYITIPYDHERGK